MEETSGIYTLKGDPKNPRKISKEQFDKLKITLKRFGDLGGIIKNLETGELVGGHMRVEAFKSDPNAAASIQITQTFEQPTEAGTVALGYVIVNNEPYSYREVRWSRALQRTANLAANHAGGDDDLDSLAEVIYELSQEENGDELLALTSIDDDDISKLLDSVGAGGDNAAEDEAPAVDEVNPPVSKLGEIYQLGGHRLMCGDSTDFGAVSDLMNGQNIQLVLTDPPYGIDVVKNSGELKRLGYAEVENDDSTDVAIKAIDVMNMLTKNQIIFGGNYFANSLPETRCWLVWDKQDGKTVDYGDGELAWTSFDKPLRIYKHIWDGFRRDSEVGDKRVHPTQKPVKLLVDILKDYSQRADNVIDLFGGSGSTLIACEQSGRTCYMMELDPHYIDVIRKRYAKHINQEADWQSATPCINESNVAQDQQTEVIPQ